MIKINLSRFEEIIENKLYSKTLTLKNEDETFNAEQVVRLIEH